MRRRRGSILQRLAVHRDPVEGLRVGVALELAQLGAPLADPRLHRREVLELARVAGEGLDLEIDRVGDVDDQLRVLPPHQVDLADLVRLEPLRGELGERHVITREGIHAVERDAGHDAVVPVGGAQVPGAVRVLDDEPVRPVPSDRRGHGHAGLAGVLHLAVGEAEEVDRLHAQGPRRVALLLLADPRDPLRGHGAVARALVAVGDDAVGDVLVLADELGDGPAGAELGVVGVGGHDQDALDGRGLARIGHGTDSFRGRYVTTLAIMRRVSPRSTGVALLWLLLAGFLILGALPNQTASIRLGGLSMLWWYG